MFNIILCFSQLYHDDANTTVAFLSNLSPLGHHHYLVFLVLLLHGHYHCFSPVYGYAVNIAIWFLSVSLGSMLLVPGQFQRAAVVAATPDGRAGVQRDPRPGSDMRRSVRTALPRCRVHRVVVRHHPVSHRQAVQPAARGNVRV